MSGTDDARERSTSDRRASDRHASDLLTADLRTADLRTADLSATADRRERFVLIGASNASLSLGAYVAEARARTGGPLEILAAHGHGRSYVAWSRVLRVRDLPSIDACGLWDVLAARAAPRTRAVVTDLGNDLVYGFDPAEIARHVEGVFDRLVAARARVVVTAVPVASVERLGRLRFEIARRVLFPGRPIALARVIALARELDGYVRDAARARGFALVVPRAEWYGLDPIHVRLTARGAACAEVLDALESGPRIGAPPARRTSADARALSRARPALRRWRGREERCPQPAVAWPDGSTLAWY